jgi:FMN phosphatase YigB (HAD superfamily)
MRREYGSMDSGSSFPAVYKFAMPLAEVVFLVDVDNTLLDNDRIVSDLRHELDRAVGDRQKRYWQIFDALWAEVGYADYLGALQRFRLENPRDVSLLDVSLFFASYPFADRLFPASLDVIAHLRQWGPVVILSDGDVVYQPRKVERSGLLAAVEGRVLIYVHKEQELTDVESRYPAQRYVFVDDKLRLLTAIKDHWKDRVTTVFPRQGQYAHDPRVLAQLPPADLAIDRIGDLLAYDKDALLAAGRSG